MRDYVSTLLDRWEVRDPRMRQTLSMLLALYTGLQKVRSSLILLMVIAAACVVIFPLYYGFKLRILEEWLVIAKPAALIITAIVAATYFFVCVPASRVFEEFQEESPELKDLVFAMTAPPREQLILWLEMKEVDAESILKCLEGHDLHELWRKIGGWVRLILAPLMIFGLLDKILHAGERRFIVPRLKKLCPPGSSLDKLREQFNDPVEIEA